MLDGLKLSLSGMRFALISNDKMPLDIRDAETLSPGWVASDGWRVSSSMELEHDRIVFYFDSGIKETARAIIAAQGDDIVMGEALDEPVTVYSKGDTIIAYPKILAGFASCLS